MGDGGVVGVATCWALIWLTYLRFWGSVYL